MDQREADKHSLNLDIAGIVIGALVVISILAWINVIKTLCEHVIEDDRKDRYSCVFRKVMAAVVLTLVSAFISIGIYIWYSRG